MVCAGALRSDFFADVSSAVFFIFRVIEPWNALSYDICDTEL